MRSSSLIRSVLSMLKIEGKGRLCNFHGEGCQSGCRCICLQRRLMLYSFEGPCRAFVPGCEWDAR
jgi:hypothetical protein